MSWSNLMTPAAVACFVCVAWALLDYFGSRRDARTFERLKEWRKPGKSQGRVPLEKESKIAKIVTTSGESLSKVLKPKQAIEQKKLKHALAKAGFHSPAAPMLFLAIKAAGMIAGFVLAGTVSALVWGVTQKSLTVTVACVAAGCMVPEFVLRMLQKRRHKRIFKSLPDALDLLVICVETGLGIDAAMRRVGKELVRRAPEVCEELALYDLHMQMGRARKDALHDLGVRTGVEDMNSLATVLIQADRFGNSIAATLRELSDMMRVKRRQFAEERAQQTAVKLIFPLVLFIFPGVFTILVGPAAILMMRDMLSMR